ncbi:MAG: cytochrome c [Chloroflexi bacterium]|nr:cytochrome c [Chloroflexota bacterium]
MIDVLRRMVGIPEQGVRPGVLLAAVLLGIAAIGCVPFARGAYQVDIFGEMHYTQAYRSQEPPRLYPPLGAVPFAPLGTASLVVGDPVPLARTPDTIAKGEYLFGVNCVVCHGAGGQGNGPMRDFLLKWGGLPPANIVAASAGSTDQEIFSFISEGGRAGFFAGQVGVESPSTMPLFKKLLTEEERWMLVHYVREIQGQ